MCVCVCVCLGVGGGRKKTEFEIICFGIVCRGEFLKQFGRHGRTECDGCQKGDIYIHTLQQNKGS